MYELLLVSQSPRRRQILQDAGFQFRTDTVKISEIIEENVNVATAIMNLAQAKAQAYLEAHNHLKFKDILILSADTMVVHRGRALGKPKNSTEAQGFLSQLSGETHSVITGLCFYDGCANKYFTFYDQTEVEFRPLSKQEICDYVATGEPMDKAGAYAIQGLAGQFVKECRGSFTNVVGLPLELFLRVLEEQGWNVPRK